jgi:ribosomal protein S18 acetylase RimI-like enzyme
VGTALLDAAHLSLRHAGARGAWLVTTNDNRAAIHMYERAGYRLREVRHGAIDDLRRTLKPSIPERAEDGTPITDELEYRVHLTG